MSLTVCVNEYHDAVSFYSSRFNPEGLIDVESMLASIGLPADYLADAGAMIAWVPPVEAKSERTEQGWALRDAEGGDIAFIGDDGSVSFATQVD